jgi:hypothetical protein
MRVMEKGFNDTALARFQIDDPRQSVWIIQEDSENHMVARYELRKPLNYHYYFNLVAAKDEKIITSELYTSKSDADG